MNDDLFSTAKMIIGESGYEVRSYSGSGMYGRFCIAFTCNNVYSAIADFIEYCLNDDELLTLASMVRDIRSDNMGYDTIVYFPSIEWVEAETDEDE
jgi:hypothetical protein